MIIPAGRGQANFKFSGAAYTRGAEVALGFDNSIVPHPAADAAQLFVDNWETNLLPLQASTLTFVGVNVKLGPNLTGPDAFVGSGAAGGETDPVAPPNVATLITKNTAAGGRKNRGRMFMPGLTDAAILTDGNYDPVVLGVLQTAVDAFVAQADSDDLSLVILHTSADDPPTPIISMTVEPRVATQRRRLRKVG